MADNGPSTIEVVPLEKAVHLVQVLGRHRDAIGGDFRGYKNHCLRVLSLALHHLGGPDGVSDSERRDLELAIGYHDIALWTDDALAYLEPSIERALGEVGDEVDDVLLRDVIYWHHKVTSFTEGPTPRHNDLVNAVRIADWADATLGLVSSFNVGDLRAVQAAFPNSGFHMALGRFSMQLQGWQVPWGILKW
eukprot:CAMPEP_0119120450 /NCGR_PEP_ID=MMETSP1310-20130426/1482_1 /TAXON_ID=464262 /ORGANISM="Genus nov. species nov., Strain RCC2339" /LENGTH=191 /DNA_ID=CAMNT_0007109927 /DNA_START=82 /DNA_END=657 /DNA_ORIENTATION=-